MPPSKSRSRVATATPKVKVRRGSHARPRYVIAAFAGPLLLIAAVLSFYYVTLSRVIETRLTGRRAILATDLRPAFRAARRPVAHRGQPDRSPERSRLRRPADRQGARRVRRRSERRRAVDARRPTGRHRRPRRVRAGRSQARTPATAAIRRIERAAEAVTGPRRPRTAAPRRAGDRTTARSAAMCRWRRFRKHVSDAVLAIEDRRFYDHPGVDPIGSAAAISPTCAATSPTWSAAARSRSRSSRTLLLTPEKTLTRKLQEQFMALVLERRFRRTRSSSCISTTCLSGSAARSRSTASPRRRGSSSARTC